MFLSRLSFISVIATISFVVTAFVTFTAGLVHKVKALVLRGFEVVAVHQPPDRAPGIRLVQARAFVQRIVRRERMRMAPGWILCPST